MTEHESIPFDVLFVGGGPACLAGAIRLMQLARDRGLDLEVALIEKGANIGDHAISGAVLNPRALEELIPDYRADGCPLEATVHRDEFYFLTSRKAFALPLTPPALDNKGCHIISLSRFTRWLGERAEELGVNIFAGFSGSQVLYGPDGKTVTGVRTGDKGLDKDGKPKSNFEPGIDLEARVTVFGEGARGSLMKEMGSRLGLYRHSMPEMFETGIKEVIEFDDENPLRTCGVNDIHLLGYPLNLGTPGGGFIYEMEGNRIAIGYLVALCYSDPRLDPYEIFLQFKRHPMVAELIAGGRVIEQGARTVSSGGYYTMPQLYADGALFAGAAAGMHNPPALKGIHAAMKSGMLAAETIVEAVQRDDFTARTLSGYRRRFDNSWLAAEMREGRNFSQALAAKGPLKFVHLAAQQLTRGRGLRDPLPTHPDHGTLASLTGDAAPPESAECDNVLFVDKLTGVYLSKTKHREDEPGHLIVHDTQLCVDRCLPTYGAPCTRFCPGNVYEMVTEAEASRPVLRLNPSNCLHCKTCDIKDPFENITWTCPEGGEGPGYKLL
jgi:electron-transferring-flavoprotein dehydrogenase